MTVPVFNHQQMVDHLEKNGFYETPMSIEIEDVDTGEKSIRTFITNSNGITFPFQKLDKYYFTTVCKICEQISIDPPEDHKKCYDQLQELRNRKN